MLMIIISFTGENLKMKKIILSAITALCITLSVSAENTHALFDKNDVNAFDRQFITSYNKKLDDVSTVLSIAQLMSPSLLVIVPTFTGEYKWDKDGWINAGKLGVMYTESFVTGLALKELAKYLIERKRPYMYKDGWPLDEYKKDGEWNESFFSGHTTYAFTAASFTSYAFCKMYPESDLKIPVIASSFALATTVGIMRVSSGCHFVTDVLVGAAVGTISGFLVPFLQYDCLIGDNASLHASPTNLSFSFKF